MTRTYAPLVKKNYDSTPLNFFASDYFFDYDSPTSSEAESFASSLSALVWQLCLPQRLGVTRSDAHGSR